MTRDEWIGELARRLGAEPPSEEEIEALLELARVAAHSSERTAAPLACWIGGRSGESPARLKEVAEEIGRS